MRIVFVAALAASLAAGHAGAAAQRTFVASTGSDSDPCSITLPCRSFAAAIGQTLDGGEIVVQDSAGYGPVTITKSVTIVAPPGIYAGVSVTGGHGIVVDAPAIDVTLRGLTINGLGGSDGIRLVQGAQLTIDRCTVSNMASNGIALQPAATAGVSITQTTVRDNGQSGIYGEGTVKLTIVGSLAERNLYGIYVRAGPTVFVRDTTVADNGNVGVGAESLAAMVTTRLTAEDVASVRNAASGFFLISGLSGTVEGHVTRGLAVDNGGDGFEVRTSYNGSGFGHVELRDSVARYNTGNGVTHTGLDSNVVVERGTFVRNGGYGIYRSNSSSGPIHTRGDNTVLNNGSGATADALTPLSGI